MVASTVANGPRSPWDAISLIIMLRIWRVKRVIDAYVLPVKVEMEMVIQQYEKAKVIQDEQLERLTQICQEQGFEIRQLRAHLAQQDLDLAAEREAALRTPTCSAAHGAATRCWRPAGGRRRPAASRRSCPRRQSPPLPSMSTSPTSPPTSSQATRPAAQQQWHLRQRHLQRRLPLHAQLRPAGPEPQQPDAGLLHRLQHRREEEEEEEEEKLSSEPGPWPRPPPRRTAEATAQDLLSSPSEGPCPPQRALDLVPVSRPGPADSAPNSPELERRLSLFNQKNQEGFTVFQIKPVVHFQPAAPALEDKFSLWNPKSRSYTGSPKPRAPGGLGGRRKQPRGCSPGPQMARGPMQGPGARPAPLGVLLPPGRCHRGRPHASDLKAQSGRLPGPARGVVLTAGVFLNHFLQKPACGPASVGWSGGQRSLFRCLRSRPPGPPAPGNSTVSGVGQPHPQVGLPDPGWSHAEHRHHRSLFPLPSFSLLA
ncbi:unnamed protein product [Nyctereutes procyonoides]|uniref:(raccoon dog) hypothetical protein n=1 Tax=Nyctereutes procyonoides TaxID=34880 RepID=A0A811YE06_NYCPR|nr:unnamed protein product [Nyctereutes procyonoides]